MERSRGGCNGKARPTPEAEDRLELQGSCFAIYKPDYSAQCVLSASRKPVRQKTQQH